jgi:hypothetical protein
VEDGRTVDTRAKAESVAMLERRLEASSGERVLVSAGRDVLNVDCWPTVTVTVTGSLSDEAVPVLLPSQPLPFTSAVVEFEVPLEAIPPSAPVALIMERALRSLVQVTI